MVVRETFSITVTSCPRLDAWEPTTTNKQCSIYSYDLIPAQWRISKLRHHALVQIGTESLSEPMAVYCELDPCEQISVKFE